MTATRKQVKLIEDLQSRGAPIPCTDHGNPDGSMFESVSNADKYIKQNIHYIKVHTTLCRPDEWGGVLNH